MGFGKITTMMIDDGGLRIGHFRILEKEGGGEGADFIYAEGNDPGRLDLWLYIQIRKVEEGKEKNIDNILHADLGTETPIQDMVVIMGLGNNGWMDYSSLTFSSPG